MTKTEQRIKTLRRVSRAWTGTKVTFTLVKGKKQGLRKTAKTPFELDKAYDAKLSFADNIVQNFGLTKTAAKKIEAYKSKAVSKTDFMKQVTVITGLQPKDIDSRW